MNYRIATLFAAAIAIGAGSPAVTLAEPPAATRPATRATVLAAWDVVHEKAFSIAIPKTWRRMDNPTPTIQVLFVGDGHALPAVDETGAPLQIGISIERFANAKKSIDDRIKALADDSKTNARLEARGEPKIESLKLADGADARFLTAGFVKEKQRGSLQMKLVVNDADGVAWVVSGYDVGGIDSKIPTADSEVAQRLRAFMLTFVLDPAKFSDAALGENEGAVKPAEGGK